MQTKVMELVLMRAEESLNFIFHLKKKKNSNRRESCEPKKAYYTNSAAFCAKRSYYFPEDMEIIS